MSRKVTCVKRLLYEENICPRHRFVKIMSEFFIINSSETSKKDRFKQMLRRFSKDINEFSFKAPMIAKKRDDFIDS